MLLPLHFLVIVHILQGFDSIYKINVERTQQRRLHKILDLVVTHINLEGLQCQLLLTKIVQFRINLE